MRNASIVLALLVASTAAVAAERTPAPADARVYFITPNDGERVHTPVTVRFGAQGIGVAPSGVDADDTGHHHLIIDGEMPALDAPIPSNDTYRHFGGGQTETTLDLAPGKHTLRLLMGDYRHIPHKPVVRSKQITIHVVE